jgi:thiol:disulfide interchange protein DsbC
MNLARSALVLGFLSLPLLALAAEYDRLRAELARHFPELAKAAIKPSPVKGIHTIEIGDQVGYVTADGKYLFLGDLIEVATRNNITSMTPTEHGKKIVEMIDAVGEGNMIVMSPANPKRTMTVFTDVDCPYCARLHQDVPELKRHGIKVRYLLFPRGGVGSPTYKKSVAAWCAADRVKAVGIAKAGGKLEMKTCTNPVEQHYRLGERVGVTGTPMIFLDTGQRIGGYAPVPRMLAAMGITPNPGSAQAP